MMHCRRVSFVCLAEPTRVVPGDCATISADGSFEIVATTLRDGGDRNDADAQDSKSRAAHTTLTLASITVCLHSLSS